MTWKKGANIKLEFLLFFYYLFFWNCPKPIWDTLRDRYQQIDRKMENQANEKEEFGKREYTTIAKNKIQSLLRHKLGSKYLSTRSGPGGTKLTYSASFLSLWASSILIIYSIGILKVGRALRSQMMSLGMSSSFSIHEF